VGDEVPEFWCDSTVGSFGYHDMVDGAWGVLVTVGDVFDAVATTELGQLAKLVGHFEARDARVTVVVSGSSKDLVQKWLRQVEKIEDVKVSFPVVVDADGAVADLFGLRDNKTTLVVLSDIDKRLQLTMHYPRRTGRNFYEILRAIDSLQLALFHQVATPANWADTQDVIVQPHLSTLAARSIFTSGTTDLRPWFKTTPQPDI